MISSFCFFALVGVVAGETTVSHFCNGYVKEPSAPVPAWVSNTTAVDTRLDAVFAVLAKRGLSAATICFDSNVTYNDVDLLNSDGQFPSITSQVRNVEWTLTGANGTAWLRGGLGFEFGSFGSNVSFATMTLADMIVSTTLKIAWGGELRLERVQLDNIATGSSVQPDAVLTVVDFEMRKSDVQIVGEILDDSERAQNRSYVWSFANLNIRESRLALTASQLWGYNASEVDRDDRGRRTSVALHNATLWSTGLHIHAVDVSMRNITEQFGLHRIVALNLDIAEAYLSTYSGEAVVSQPLQYTDDFNAEFDTFGYATLPSSFFAIGHELNATNVVFDECRAIPALPPLFLNLWTKHYSSFQRNLTLPTFAHSLVNVTIEMKDAETECQWECPSGWPSVTMDGGLTCTPCGEGFMPDVLNRHCVECEGDCWTQKCSGARRWSNQTQTCEACDSGVVFDGTMCECPPGMVAVANQFAQQHGILVCADKQCDFMLFDSICLTLQNGLAFGGVAVVLAALAAILTACAMRRKSRRNNQNQSNFGVLDLEEPLLRE